MEHVQQQFGSYHSMLPNGYKSVHKIAEVIKDKKKLEIVAKNISMHSHFLLQSQYRHRKSNAKNSTFCISKYVLTEYNYHHDLDG